VVQRTSLGGGEAREVKQPPVSPPSGNDVALARKRVRFTNILSVLHGGSRIHFRFSRQESGVSDLFSPLAP
jgi:hypothetical protein